MSTFELLPEEEELANKDRLVNAWLAGQEEASPSDIAEVTNATTAYASRIRSEMKEGEITEADVEEVRDDQLVDEYASRLEQLAQGEAADETGDAEATEGSTEEEEQAQEAPEQPQQTQQPAGQQQQPPRQQQAQ